MSRKSPHISIIIPTYQRPMALAACLSSIAGQKLDRQDYEVLVVNDGDEAGHAGIISHYQNAIDLTYLHQEHSGPARARNLGSSRARGRYLAFIDDDCRAEPLWLGYLLLALSKGDDLGVGGHTLNGSPHNPFAVTSHLLHEQFSQRENSGPGGVRFIASNNLAVSLRKFEELGGFNESFGQAGGEDRDFCQRWILKNGYLKIIPKARIWHFHDLNFRQLFKQHFRYGQGSYYLAANSDSDEIPGLASKLSFSLGLLRAPWLTRDCNRKITTSMLLLLSQLALLHGIANRAVISVK